MKMTTSSSSFDDESLAKIKMGVNVDIKRSDGKNEWIINGYEVEGNLGKSGEQNSHLISSIHDDDIVSKSPEKIQFDE